MKIAVQERTEWMPRGCNAPTDTKIVHVVCGSGGGEKVLTPATVQCSCLTKRGDDAIEGASSVEYSRECLQCWNGPGASHGSS